MPSTPRVNEARVRQLLAQGCTAKQIGLRLGVSKSVVSAIRSGSLQAKGNTNG